MTVRYGIRAVSWRQQSLTVRGSVHYVGESGRSMAIFVHGFTGHRIGPHYLYVRLAHALYEAGVSSLRYDCPGSGESDGDFSEMTLSVMVDSVVGAVRFARRRYNPSRLVLIGHSLGGCAAALASVKVCADDLVLLAPVADPRAIAAERKGQLSPLPAGSGNYEYGAFLMKAEFLDDLARHDPMTVLADGYRGGLLLFQGDADPSVLVGESGRYIHWAQRAGIRAGYHVLAGVDHNFSTVASIATLGTQVTEWLRG